MSDTPNTSPNDENPNAQNNPNTQDASADAQTQSDAPAPQPVNDGDSATDEKTEESAPKLVPITDPAIEKRARKEAVKALADARKLYKRGKKQLTAERQHEIENAIDTLTNALKDKSHSCVPAHRALRDLVNKRLKFARKSAVREIAESLLFALIFALVLRTVLIEPFKIPTRSMVPTLLEGDQLFVTKLSYGVRLPFLNKYVVRFSEPQRGDVVVFAFPNQSAADYHARTNSGCLPIDSLSEEKDYIKRIIGVEGDTIEVIDQVVYVNGEPVAQQPFYERTVSDYRFLSDRLVEHWNRETLENAVFTTITHDIASSHFGPVKV